MSSEQPTLFEGKYEVISKIAEGGMGSIYKVRHVLLNEVRVIKVMRPQAAEKEEHRKRFLREAQMATRLRHPNIVTFYDFAVDESDTAYMVMEFIDGVTFNQLIRSGGAVPPAITLTLARQCLSALAYLHRRDIVHRDVSPDNIMIAAEDESGAHAKLIDLGIAKAVQEESLTVGAAFIGKLRYCSPEQLSMTTALDGRSDLFSFGIVLSEMLTGICPLGGDSAQSILMAHVSGRFLPFEHTDPHGRVPASLRAVVDRALQIDRSARIQSAEEFGRLIEEAQVREGLQTGPEELRAFVERAIATRKAAPVKPASSASASPLEARLPLPSTKTGPRAAPVAPIEKTERWQPAVPAAAEPQPVGKRPRVWLLLPILALAGLVGYWAATRANKAPENALSPESQPTSPPSAPTLSPVPPTAPAPTAPPRAAVPPAVREEPTAPLPTAPLPTPRPRPTPAPERVATRPVRIAEAVVPAPGPPRERTRYCSATEPTSYAQATASEKPAGFDTGGAEVFRGPRPDAARITIKVEVVPPTPLEGQPFRVVARLINGGDSGITLKKIEESAPRARGGFQPVSGVAAPATVQAGATLTLYTYEGALSEGTAYAKDVRITDVVGDTWKTTVRVGVCPD